MKRMKRALNHVLDIWAMTAAMLLVVIVIGAACVGNNDDAMLADYAECLFDKGLARDATAADTLARLQASVESGEETIERIQAGHALLCAE